MPTADNLNDMTRQERERRDQSHFIAISGAAREHAAQNGVATDRPRFVSLRDMRRRLDVILPESTTPETDRKLERRRD